MRRARGLALPHSLAVAVAHECERLSDLSGAALQRHAAPAARRPQPSAAPPPKPAQRVEVVDAPA